jgi:hypothetical protein
VGELCSLLVPKGARTQVRMVALLVVRGSGLVLLLIWSS